MSNEPNSDALRARIAALEAELEEQRKTDKRQPLQVALARLPAEGGSVADRMPRVLSALEASEELERRVEERTSNLAKANQALERRLERIASRRHIDINITASLDLYATTLDVVLGQVRAQLRVDAAAVLSSQPGSDALEYLAKTGFRSPEYLPSEPLWFGPAGRTVRTGNALPVMDLRGIPEVFATPFVRREGFIAYGAVPLIAKGEIKGVLELFHRDSLAPDDDWLDFLETVAGQVAVAIDNATLFENLQRSNRNLIDTYDATIESWARLLDLRDQETEGHSRRVAEMSLRLAQTRGIGRSDMVPMRRGALLHDIGKMAVPDSILLKPGSLTDEERRIMRLHPEYAYEMLSPIEFLRPALDIPYCHHEKWDGSGYPRGLQGENIPLVARIFAIVDVWDALRSDRPYRTGWPNEKVEQYIKAHSGTHFDPDITPKFLDLLRDESGVSVIRRVV